MKLDTSFHKHFFSAKQRQHITREFRVVEESYNCDNFRVHLCVVKESITFLALFALFLLYMLSVSGIIIAYVWNCAIVCLQSFNDSSYQKDDWLYDGHLRFTLRWTFLFTIALTSRRKSEMIHLRADNWLKGYRDNLLKLD